MIDELVSFANHLLTALERTLPSWLLGTILAAGVIAFGGLTAFLMIRKRVIPTPDRKSQDHCWGPRICVNVRGGAVDFDADGCFANAPRCDYASPRSATRYHAKLHAISTSVGDDDAELSVL